MFEKIRDILFDIRDFVIVIVIISVLVFSVTWKIGETLDVDIDSKVVVNIESTTPTVSTSPTLPATTAPPTSTPSTTVTTASTTVTTVGKIVRFQVKEGEFGQDIADNLLQFGLIESADAFLVKAHEMGVDTSLRTGVYELRTDDDLETIIKLLSGGSR